MRNLRNSELNSLALKLLAVLDGISMDDALHALTKRAPALLREGHFVQIDSERFRAMTNELNNPTCENATCENAFTDTAISPNAQSSL